MYVGTMQSDWEKIVIYVIKVVVVVILIGLKITNI